MPPPGSRHRCGSATATQSIDLTTIDQAIAGGASGTAETTGTDSFVASVPAKEHDVALVLTEAGFTQSFDLWTLQRLAPSPAVLYRDASSSTVTGSAASSFNVAFTNPADGFSSSDDAQVSSATLSWFAPGGSGRRRARIPGVPGGRPAVLLSRHPLRPAQLGPLLLELHAAAGNRLTFTPTAARRSPAPRVPPPSLRRTPPVMTTASSTASTGSPFPHPPPAARSPSRPGRRRAPSTPASPGAAMGHADQSSPPRRPSRSASRPHRGSASPEEAALGGRSAAGHRSRSSANDSTTSSSGGGAFPIWLAVVVLVAVAGLVVAVQRVFADGVLQAQVMPTASLDDAATTDVANRNEDRPLPTRQRPRHPSWMEDNPATVVTPKAVGILGWRRFVGFPVEGATPNLEALTTYLALHDAPPPQRRSDRTWHVAARSLPWGDVPQDGPQQSLGPARLGRRRAPARRRGRRGLSARGDRLGLGHLPAPRAGGRHGGRRGGAGPAHRGPGSGPRPPLRRAHRRRLRLDRSRRACSAP